MNPEFKSALWNIAGIFIIVGIISFLALSKWQIIVFLCLYVGLSMAFKCIGHNKVFSFGGFGISCVRIVIFVHLFIYLAQFGWWGFVAANFLLAGYIIWIRWQRFMKGIRDLEIVIFGKSLDRENWVDEKPPGLIKALRGSRR